MINKKNKKGAISIKTFLFIGRLFFLIIIAIIFISIMRAFIVKSLNTAEIEKDILVNRVIYSPSGLSCFDSKTGRFIPGIIDVNNMDSKRIDYSIDYKNNMYIAAKVTLLDKQEGNKEIKSFIYNKLWYDRFLPRAFARGPGSVLKYEEHIPVLYTETGDCFDTKKGELDIIILVPR